MKGIYCLIHESAQKYPEKTFVQRGDDLWSYSEAETLAKGVAEHLSKFGVKNGDRVAIFCDNSMQYIAALFGVLRINAIAVPLNPIKMTDSILYITEKCSPKLIIACNATIGRLRDIEHKLCAHIFNIDCLDIWSNFRHCISSVEEEDSETDGNSAAMILFTSGTTAHPKGVTLTHENLLVNSEAIVEYLQLTSRDSILMTLPFTYSYGNSVLLTHILAGASMILENSTAFPMRILEGIKNSRASGFSTVGSYINLMLKLIRNSSEHSDFLDSLRYITFAGEATQNDDVLFITLNYPGIKVYVMYGQTEAGARLSYLSPEMLPAKIGSIGKGLSNTQLKVVNEVGSEVEPGEVGEIIARGPNIMKNYWEDYDATMEVVRDGWLYTGDNATVDEDGFIYIKGRKTDMLKHMGHRISPAEIESVLNAFGGIKESAVVEGSLGGMSVLKAVVVPERECSIEEVKSYLYPKLPLYMRPQIIEFIEQLPRTDTGKIRRSVLRSS